MRLHKIHHDQVGMKEAPVVIDLDKVAVFHPMYFVTTEGAFMDVNAWDKGCGGYHKSYRELYKLMCKEVG